MSGKFQPINRNTPYLLPPSLQDWLPEKHLARFVVDIIATFRKRFLPELEGLFVQILVDELGLREQTGRATSPRGPGTAQAG